MLASFMFADCVDSNTRVIALYQMVEVPDIREACRVGSKQLAFRFPSLAHPPKGRAFELTDELQYRGVEPIIAEAASLYVRLQLIKRVTELKRLGHASGRTRCR